MMDKKYLLAIEVMLLLQHYVTPVIHFDVIKGLLEIINPFLLGIKLTSVLHVSTKLG